MGELQELKIAYETSLLKKQLRKSQLENELLVRENLLLKQQVRVLKGGGSRESERVAIWGSLRPY